MWCSRRRRAPGVPLPPCADGTRAHRFAVQDAAPLPDGRVVAVKRTCGRCEYRDTIPKFWAFDGSAPYSTQGNHQTVYGFTKAGYLLSTWKPRPS